MTIAAFESAVERVAGGADHHAEAAALVELMTVDEKLGCLDGDLPFWPGVIDMSGGGYHRHTWPAARVERLGVPGLHFADGPRGCVVGRSTSFPVSMARGATFDPVLEEGIGRAIGAELRAHGATYTGAVCMNLLRHPAWGRAQETYGEDPHHVGEMAAAFTRGLQAHVMACMKHYALNSMENARFRVDVTADERALHEVYLPHFRRVADEGVASVMSAYNSVNGEWCGENRTLLLDILRDEWKWDGFVTSDFIFGLRDPVKSVQAGLDIEMPFAQQRAVALEDALDDGRLQIGDVNARVEQIVGTFLRFSAVFGEQPPMSVVACDDHRTLARRAAERSIVLLHNRDDVLPLDPASAPRVAVLGRLARIENLGDRGSSNVFPPEVSTPIEGLRSRFGEVVHHDTDLRIVDDADVAIVVVGTTWVDEGEFIDDAESGRLSGELFPPNDDPRVGFDATLDIPGPVFDDPPTPAGQTDNDGFTGSLGGDRASLGLSDRDLALIEGSVAANPNTIVVVMGGSAVTMPWLDTTAAALMLWYPGMEGGTALADVIAGHAEPGGRLPFAIPADEAHLAPFDADADRETYGLLHGQWYLDANGQQAHLPFGHGLSYSHLSIDAATVSTTDGATTAQVSVTNRGSRDGSTVVFVFASVPGSGHERPPKRLVGFVRVDLGTGESATTTIGLDLDQLRVRADGTWIREPGDYRFSVGRSASSIDHIVDVEVVDG